MLNGTGGATRRRFFSTADTRADIAPSMRAIAVLAAASSLKRAVACGASKASSPSPSVGPAAAPASKRPRITQ